MKIKYPVIFYNDDPTAAFYDFGLSVSAKTMEELTQKIQSEFDWYCAELKKDGIPLPAPTPLDKVDVSRHSGTIDLVEVDVNENIA
jgi:predicted RNase H-like HicB family nuclease